MISNYAVIVEASGLVENVMVWDGEQPIQLPDGRIAVEMEYGAIGWFYHDGVFSPPEQEPPTAEEVLASQSAKLLSLKNYAELQKSAITKRISVLQDAIDNIGIEGAEEFAATPEEQAEFTLRKTQLAKWKNYAILLGRVTSQEGWPPNVQWPVQPAEGIDLTTSSSVSSTVS